MDSKLFRQVLTNIIANGVEANDGRIVRFVIQVSGDASSARGVFADDRSHDAGRQDLMCGIACVGCRQERSAFAYFGVGV